MFKFLFGEFFVSFFLSLFLSSKIKRIYHQSLAMEINSVHLVTMCQIERKKKLFFSFFPFQTISIGNLPNSQSCFSRSSIIIIYCFLFVIFFSLVSVCQSVCVGLSVCLSIYLSIYLAVYVSIHPSIQRTHLQSIVWIPNKKKKTKKKKKEKNSGASKYIQLLRIIGKHVYTCTRIKDTIDCLRAPLVWHVWRRRQKGFQKWQFHYVTIKSKTLNCHFNQNTAVLPSVRSSFRPSIFALVRNDQNEYETTKMGTKWIGYELTTII